MSFDPHSLLGAMFECVADDDAFAALPARIAAFAQTASVQIQIHTPTAARTEAVHGIDAAIIKPYNEYYWKRDLWAIGYSDNKFNSTVASERYILESDFIRSEIYNDLLKRNGDFFRCVGFVADIGCGEHLLFGAHRTRQQSEFEAELIRSMEVLHPYLDRLMRARRRVAEGPGRLAEHLIDMERDPILIVGYDGRVHFANAAAKQGCERGFPLRMVSGRLSAADPVMAVALARTIRWACSGKGGGTLALDRSVMEALDVSVDSLSGCDRKFARVRLRDREAELQGRLSAARAKFMLTPAETALAEALLRGMALAAFAHSRGVTMPTVRSQLQSLFGKTGTSRQVDLVAMLRDLPMSI